MQLYLIRHAQSYNNALDNFSQRMADPHLTKLGHRQAQIVADYLGHGINRDMIAKTVENIEMTSQRGFGITKLYCSAMYRALQTTSPISKALGIAPEIWLDTHEYGGIYLEEEDQIVGYSGKTRSEISAEFPEYVVPDTITETGWWQGGREDWPYCHGRAISTADKLRKLADQDETIALVTHGGFIDALLKAIFNQLPTQHIFYHHYNTAITRLDFHTDGPHVNVWYLNRIDHLPPELIS